MYIGKKDRRKKDYKKVLFNENFLGKFFRRKNRRICHRQCQLKFFKGSDLGLEPYRHPTSRRRPFFRWYIIFSRVTFFLPFFGNYFFFMILQIFF